MNAMMNQSLPAYWGCVICLICLGFTTSAHAATSEPAPASAVLLSRYENTPGEGSQFPFDGDGARWQNIYNASDLLSAMPFGGTILRIAFRMDEHDRASFEATIPDLEIRMSTSLSSWPNNISQRFAQNVGPDETVVFGRGSAQFSVQGSSSGPNPFEIIFPLSRPFSYDPRQGSLAVDIFVYKRATRSLLLDTPGGLALAGGVPPFESSSTFSSSPIMQVTFLPVPEPPPIALITIAPLLLIWATRRKSDEARRGCFSGCCIAIAACFLFLPVGAGAQEVDSAMTVVLTRYTENPGPGSQAPFNLSGTRYQNIYNGNDFIDAMPPCGTITPIAFRIDEANRNSFTTVIPDLEIRISTSPSTWPDRLSNRFAGNVGPDETIVFARGSIQFSVIGSDGPANPFLISFPLSRPFSYDPRKGSLAVGLFTYRRTVGPGLLLDTSGGVALVGGVPPFESSNTLLGAPIMQLTFMPVPEPTAAGLCLAMGAVGLFAGGTRFRKWSFTLPAGRLNTAFAHFSVLGLVAVACFPDANGQPAEQPLVTSVVPPQYTERAGEGSQAPFDLSGSRYQNIYNASDILPAMPQGGMITQITFRVDESDRSSLNAIIPDLEIRMSTGTMISPNISHRFTENVGADETVVLSRGSFQVSAQGSSSGSNPFQIAFPLSRSFAYDPRKGGLVVDLFVYGGSTRSLLLDTGGAIALVGGIPFESSSSILGAPVLQLTFLPVPEPNICALAGLFSAVWISRRRRREHSGPHLEFQRNRFFYAVAIVLPFMLNSVSAQEAQPAPMTAVAPSQYANAPGGGSQTPFAFSGLRYQNVYAAADFLSAMPFGGTITRIAFRIDERNRSSFAASIPDLEIRMSTSPVTLPNISNRFAENVGPDESVVFERGQASFSVQGASSGANPFQIEFPLTKPFLYDPQRGSLAVDLFIHRESTPTLTLDSDGALALVAGINSDRSDTILGAPIMQLTFMPVPEPRIYALLAIAAAAVLIRKMV